MKAIVALLLIVCCVGCQSREPIPPAHTFIRFKNTLASPVRRVAIKSEINGVVFTNVVSGAITDYRPFYHRGCFGFIELDCKWDKPMVFHASSSLHPGSHRGHFTYTLTSHESDVEVIDVIVTRD